MSWSKQVGEGDTAGSLTNGVQTATAVATLPPGHEVIPGKSCKNAVTLFNKLLFFFIWSKGTNASI